MAEMELFDYQAYAAAIMATKDRFGLHDTMGIGKTATTIGAINYNLAERGFIICPAMLRANWQREFKRFSTYPLRVCKAANFHDFIAWKRDRFDVLLMSYELATKWAPFIHEHGEFVDFIAMDEAHYLKNVEANRTRSILGIEAGGENSLVQYAEHAWHVTGTPMSNDPMDAYAFLRFAKAVDLSPTDFTKTFFHKRKTQYGARHSVKPEMLTTLQELFGNNSIRRSHADVGMYLPPIWLKEMIIEGSTIDLDAAMANYPNLEDIIIEAIETGNIGLLEIDYIATVRRLVGKAKAVSYAEMLKWELDAGARKRVCFFCHTEPLLYVAKFLERYGYKVVLAYGDTPEHERQEAVRQFMEGDADVFLGNIRVAGVGLTLTASSEIDMVESDWSPANNAQAIKRVHRYGQDRDVHARFITLANSIDEAVNRTVAAKTAAIAEIEGVAMTAAPLDSLR